MLRERVTRGTETGKAGLAMAESLVFLCSWSSLTSAQKQAALEFCAVGENGLVQHAVCVAHASSQTVKWVFLVVNELVL